MPDNPAFSDNDPNLQIVYDSTSLNNLAFCPRFYQYTNLEGWQGASIDLEFGQMAATAWELYQKARLEGLDKWAAARPAVRYLMEASWLGDGRQWGGAFEDQWHCTGTEPYKNNKGNRAKCPYAHKGAWFPAPAPEICGECGSAAESVRNYIPEHKQKNRRSLIRVFVWYVDEQPDELEQGVQPYRFPDGTPAVELSGKVPLPWKAPTGETYILAVNLDYIGQYGTELFIADNKTTTKGLGERFWTSYEPHMQVDTYDLVGSLLFPDLDLSGVMIDAAQVTIDSAAFGRHFYRKDEAQREEHLETIRFWIGQAEQYAAAGYWPMNKRNCWVCPFKGVCSKTPASRPRLLKEGFTKREPWDASQER